MRPGGVRVPVCASAGPKRHLQVLLSRSQGHNWVQECIGEIEDILNDESTDRILHCPCRQCLVGRRGAMPPSDRRERSMWMGKLRKSKRLFATCIILDRGFLMFSLLRGDLDDERFDFCIVEADIIAAADVSLDNARSLLKWKEAFFNGGRINLFSYLRSTKARDRPTTDERNWLLDEVLALMEKLALPPGAYARKLPPATTVGDITIRDSVAKANDREKQDGLPTDNQSVGDLKRHAMCMKALGYLVLDLVWFLAGGGGWVRHLDQYRAPGPNWVKETNWRDLEKLPDLLKAFEFVWIMICPNGDFGLSKDEHERYNYKYVLKHFRRIWPDTTYHPLTDPEMEQNSEMGSLSSQGMGASGQSPFVELERDTFRWIILKYGRENEPQRRCRLAVYVSKDMATIKLDRFNFDYDAINASPCFASTRDLRFVPLYAHGYQGQSNVFSAKFELKSESDMNLAIPYVFTFQTIEDVKKFQTALTSREIEKDVLLNRFSLNLKLNRTLTPRSWIDRGKLVDFDLGRAQLWTVVDNKELENIHLRARMAHRGKEPLPLRLEIALFSNKMLYVVRVKSNLALSGLSNFGLRIESSHPTLRAHSLEGRRLSTSEGTARVLAYPGLPLFQQPPLKYPEEGEGIHFESVELYFTNKDARDDLKQHLETRYNNNSRAVHK